MPRLARIVAVNIPHHVTQRGNAKQHLLSSDAERTVYLELLQEYVSVYPLSVLGYCLMFNHVHLVVAPREPTALADSMKQIHGRYASYWNAAHKSSGHAWQGRFYSCPLDSAHLWIVLRYTELNPVRANLVTQAAAWSWSSAAAHCGDRGAPEWLEMQAWSNRWSSQTWRDYLACPEARGDLVAIRRSTHTGRPLGTADFTRALEQTTQRSLTAQNGGRPRRPTGDDGQELLAFGS